MNLPNVAIDRESFAIYTDIHSDIESLEKALSLALPTTYKVCLGDVVGYGDNPQEVISVVKNFDVGIMGNHDSAALYPELQENFSARAKRKLKENLAKMSQDDLYALNKFQDHYSRGRNILLFHGVPGDNTKYIHVEDDVREVFEKNLGKEVLIGGHLHYPTIARRNKENGDIDEVEIPNDVSRYVANLDLDKFSYLITCPPIHQPRKGFNKGVTTFHHQGPRKKSLVFSFFN